MPRNRHIIINGLSYCLKVEEEDKNEKNINLKEYIAVKKAVNIPIIYIYNESIEYDIYVHSNKISLE